MSDTKHTLGPSAEYLPQGTCPKPWIAVVDGKALYDKRGGAKRYATEKAALKAATAAASSEQASA